MMNAKIIFVASVALCCLCVNESAGRSFTFTGASGQVVRRENGKPQPVPDAFVYLTFEEGYTINALGVGPSHVTVKRYDYHAQTDQDGRFLFPAVTVHYWSPILSGHPHYITQPKMTPVATQDWTYIVRLVPTNANCYVSGGTTFGNQPFIIPTNSVFVGKGLTPHDRESLEHYERTIALELLRDFDSPTKALAIFNQGNAQDAPQGQVILEYLMEHGGDREMRERFIRLVTSWANAESTVKEMAEDQKSHPGQYSPNHCAFVYRSKYAFDSLQALKVVHDGMTLEQAVAVFGKANERRAEGRGGDVAWSLSPPFGGGLRYQLRATVDPDGIVQSIQRSR